jgi:hypothetical protein
MKNSTLIEGTLVLSMVIFLISLIVAFPLISLVIFFVIVVILILYSIVITLVDLWEFIVCRFDNRYTSEGNIFLGVFKFLDTFPQIISNKRLSVFKKYTIKQIQKWL